MLVKHLPLFLSQVKKGRKGGGITGPLLRAPLPPPKVFLLLEGTQIASHPCAFLTEVITIRNQWIGGWECMQPRQRSFEGNYGEQAERQGGNIRGKECICG